MVTPSSDENQQDPNSLRELLEQISHYLLRLEKGPPSRKRRRLLAKLQEFTGQNSNKS